MDDFDNCGVPWEIMYSFVLHEEFYNFSTTLSE